MHPTIVPYGSFAAADGYIIIAVLSETFWPKLCQALERPELAEDKRFSTLPDRRENREILEEIISEVIRSRQSWSGSGDWKILTCLTHRYSASARRYLILMRARDMVVTVEHRDIGDLNDWQTS